MPVPFHVPNRTSVLISVIGTSAGLAQLHMQSASTNNPKSRFFVFIYVSLILCGDSILRDDGLA